MKTLITLILFLISSIAIGQKATVSVTLKSEYTFQYDTACWDARRINQWNLKYLSQDSYDMDEVLRTLAYEITMDKMVSFKEVRYGKTFPVWADGITIIVKYYPGLETTVKKEDK